MSGVHERARTCGRGDEKRRRNNIIIGLMKNVARRRRRRTDSVFITIRTRTTSERIVRKNGVAEVFRFPRHGCELNCVFECLIDAPAGIGMKTNRRRRSRCWGGFGADGGACSNASIFFVGGGG